MDPGERREKGLGYDGERQERVRLRVLRVGAPGAVARQGGGATNDQAAGARRVEA